MIALRPMRPEKGDYLLMQRWFMEPGLQKWVWCDTPGEGKVPLARIAEKYGARASMFCMRLLRFGADAGAMLRFLPAPAANGMGTHSGAPGSKRKLACAHARTNASSSPTVGWLSAGATA